MSKRAILYPRVSTDEQAQQGYSIQSQLEACRQYAADNGFEVVGEFCEDYTGTVPIESRPEGRKAYQMLRDGQADALIAYRIDRIVRPPEDGDEWDMPVLIRGLAKLGREIHTVDRGRLGTSFAELLMALLDAKGAGEERRKLIERSRRGKYTKARTGKPVGSMTTYGYRHERDDNGKIAGLVIVETEADVIRLIFTWYVNGDESGRPLSGREIARKLSEMRIKTPGETRRSVRVRPSGMWDASHVLRLLQCETFTGVWKFGVRIGNTGKMRPPEEHITVNIPPIVDRKLWEAAQARRVFNKQMQKRRCWREYLLRGMVRCGCGSAMCGEFIRNRRYYRCSWHTNHLAGLEGEACKESAVQADRLEALAWDCVMEQFSDAEKFEQALRLAQQEELDKLAPKRDELAMVEAMLAECEREAAEYADELTRTRAGKVRQALEARVQEFEARYAALAAKREKLQADLSRRTFTDEAIQTTLQLREDVYLGMQDPDYETKRRNFEKLGVLVEVKDRRARVYCRALGSVSLEYTVSAPWPRPAQCQSR